MHEINMPEYDSGDEGVPVIEEENLHDDFVDHESLESVEIKNN